MTIRRRLWFTLGWFVFVLAVAAGILAATIGADVPQSQANSVAGATGAVAGVTVAIGWAVLWLPVASEMGKRKRAERERARQNRR
jgi:nitrate reductase gamma subunit